MSSKDYPGPHKHEIDVSFTDDNMNYSVGAITSDVITSSVFTPDTLSINYTTGYLDNTSYFPHSIYGNSQNTVTINTKKGSVNMDELVDLIEVIKKRLLILTPNLDLHERYPLLKQLYDEYTALEKLLSGPDSQGDQ